jgi:hypothetical protein
MKTAIPGYDSEPDICCEEQLIMATGLKQVVIVITYVMYTNGSES